MFFHRLARIEYLFGYLFLSDDCHTIQTIEENIDKADNDGDSDVDEDDIEAQIKKEVEGMKPGSKKSRQLQAIRMDIPCGASNSLAS